MVLVILVSANSDWTWKMMMMYLLSKSLSAADIDRIAQSVAQVLADHWYQQHLWRAPPVVM